MGAINCKGGRVSNEKSSIIASKIKYIKPPRGSNVPREVIKGIKRHKEKVLMVDGIAGRAEDYTGARLWDITSRLATGLMKSDIKLEVGDPVLLTCDHTAIEKFYLLAALYAGGVIMGTAPSGYDHVKNFAVPIKPKVIVTSNEQLESAKRLRKEVIGMNKTKIILIEPDAKSKIDISDEENMFYGQELVYWPEIDEKLIQQRVSSKIKPKVHESMLMMTSGSTGLSKVVPWTHEKQLSDIWSIISATKQGVYSKESPMLPISDDSVLAGDLPLDQGPGLVAMLWSLITGAKIVIIESYNEEQYWRDVHKFKLTACIGSSTFTYRLLKKLVQWQDQPPEGPAIDIRSMSFITCAGAKVNIGPLMDKLRPIYKNLQVTQFYGATEIGFISMLAREDSLNTYDTVGHLFPGVRAKVVKLRNDVSLGPGEEGQMVVKSPSLFSQYVPYPGEKLEELMRDRFDEQGFYRTGDLVHYDSEQRFFIHSRIKDTLFLDQDWKTSPAEIESFIDKHPAVEASVVIGIPNPEVEGCVIPKAFIKLKSIEELEQFPSTNAEEYQRVRNLIKQLKAGRHDQVKEDIFNLTAVDLAEQKQLHGGIRIVDDFPRLKAFAKIDRIALSKMD